MNKCYKTVQPFRTQSSFDPGLSVTPRSGPSVHRVLSVQSVLPFSRPGMISAAMLGLGRALGETIAVALILSAVFEINWKLTEPGGNSIAANIALKWGEAGDNGRSALSATGLVLFFITLVVNMTARWVVNRRKDFSGAN